MPVAKPKQAVSAMSLLERLCSVDDFWKADAPALTRLALPRVGKKRHRAGAFHPSEIMTFCLLRLFCSCTSFTEWFETRLNMDGKEVWDQCKDGVERYA